LTNRLVIYDEALSYSVFAILTIIIIIIIIIIKKYRL